MSELRQANAMAKTHSLVEKLVGMVSALEGVVGEGLERQRTLENEVAELRRMVTPL